MIDPLAPARRRAIVAAQAKAEEMAKGPVVEAPPAPEPPKRKGKR